MTAVDELIAFVRQQLDEDEGLARAADEKRHRAIVTDALARPEIGTHNNARLIARWDPARVLAEVEAKRQRIDWLASLQHETAGEDFPVYDSCRILAQPGDLGDLDVGYCSCGLDARREHLLKIDAQPYAGQPGWREEWQLSDGA